MTAPAPISYRTVQRTVRVEVEISGHLAWQYPRDGGRSLLVESVELRYEAGDEHFVTADIRGLYLLRSGKPGKSRAEDSAPLAYELWPTWLQELERVHRPGQYLEHRGPLSGGAA